MSRNRAYWGVAISLTVAAWIATAVLYSNLPDQIPTHWNLRGEVDATGSKSWAAFLVPGAMVSLLGLFAVLPWLSPRSFSVDAFRTTYLYIMSVMVGLFGYIQVLVLMASLRAEMDMSRWLIGGMLFFIALLGNVLGRVRRNFYIGVRVPWTLASERVWNETHRLAAWLFVICGLMGVGLIVAGLDPKLAFAVLMVAVIVPVLFSLARYKVLEGRGELGPPPG